MLQRLMDTQHPNGKENANASASANTNSNTSTNTNTGRIVRKNDRERGPGLSLYEVFTCTASKPGSFINNCGAYEVPENELVTFGIDFKQRQ